MGRSWSSRLGLASRRRWARLLRSSCATRRTTARNTFGLNQSTKRPPYPKIRVGGFLHFIKA
ncbi:MAG: hypothetical protein EOP10_14310 [Proteobacteria bacterium]|nr:MAG: hypothetical protein EOP10_14310 [Pseudomonadota bacterium]